MRKTTPVRIGDLWAEFVESSPAHMRKLAESRIPEVWPGIVGERVAVFTSSLKMERGVLYVTISSSAARHAIFMQRDSLRDAINRELGMKVVNVVIVK